MLIEHKPFAEKARKQRQTEAYKAWRAVYEKTEKFRQRIREYSKRRRADPAIAETLRKYWRKSAEKNRIKILVRHAILRCKRTGMPFDRDFLIELSAQRPLQCPCCSVTLSYAVTHSTKSPKFDGPSLDRIDTTMGYLRGNVAIICWRCNALKRDGVLREFEAIVAYMRARL